MPSTGWGGGGRVNILHFSIHTSMQKHAGGHTNSKGIQVIKISRKSGSRRIWWAPWNHLWAAKFAEWSPRSSICLKIMKTYGKCSILILIRYKEFKSTDLKDLEPFYGALQHYARRGAQVAHTSRASLTSYFANQLGMNCFHFFEQRLFRFKNNER